MLEYVIIQYNIKIVQILSSHDLLNYKYIIFVLLNIKNIFVHIVPYCDTTWRKINDKYDLFPPPPQGLNL